MSSRRIRAVIGFAILFGIYQTAEGLGGLTGSFAVQAGFMVACVAAAWPVGRYVLGFHGWDAYALEHQPKVLLWLVGGVALAMLAKLAALFIGQALGQYEVRFETSLSAASVLPWLLMAMISTFIPSLAEDILTRGFWWRVPRPVLRGALFVLVSSVIYVLNHLYRLHDGPVEWFRLFCFGLAYAVALARTGSLWAAVGVHWGWNLTNALLAGVIVTQGAGDLVPYISAGAHLLMVGAICLIPTGQQRPKTQSKTQS